MEGNEIASHLLARPRGTRGGRHREAEAARLRLQQLGHESRLELYVMEEVPKKKNVRLILRPTCSPALGERVVDDTEKPKRPGSACSSLATSVDLPTPEGPASTSCFGAALPFLPAASAAAAALSVPDFLSART